MIIAQTRSSLLRLMMFSLVIWTATSSLAQVYPGRVTGRVQDAQGAVVSGANVKLTNPSTGLERTVTTDENGGRFRESAPSVDRHQEGFKRRS